MNNQFLNRRTTPNDKSAKDRTKCATNQLPSWKKNISYWKILIGIINDMSTNKNNEYSKSKIQHNFLWHRFSEHKLYNILSISPQSHLFATTAIGRCIEDRRFRTQCFY